MSLSAFFLCAGHGTRLRPLTDRVPKPAIPFLGRSALEINIRTADALDPEYRLANAHHLPDAIRAVAGPSGTEVLFETEILGTGGALANAADRLRRTDHFLVHNGDLIHDIDLAALYREHLDSGALATLAGLRPEAGPNTLAVSAEGALLGIHGFHPPEGPEAKRLTFAGIAFYRREFLEFVAPGPEDIKPCWIRALHKSRNDPAPEIRIMDVSGTPWFDFGTPQGLWDAAKHRMRQTGVYTHGYAAPEGERPFVSNEAGLPDLPGGLRNLVVYEEPRMPLEEGTTNLLTGLDFDWKVRP